MQHRPSRREALALGAAFLATPRSAFAQGLIGIKAGGVPEDSIAPAVWAQQSGQFKKNGLDVDVESQRSGSAVASAVSGGSYQFGKSSLPALIIAHSRGIPFVLVAPGGLYEASNPVIGLLVRNDSTIKTGADLNGKTVAVSSLSDLYAIATRQWVDKHGGDSSTLKLIEMPISAVAPALAAGRVDAGCCIEPALEAALGDGKVKVLCAPCDAIAPAFLYTGWFTTADYAEKNRSVIDAFAKTIREVAAYTNAHRAATDDAMSKFSGVPVATMRKMRRVTNATALDVKMIQPLIDATARANVIAKPFDAKELLLGSAR
jgi:NitT/TauT family transport system substrate-binding protein